MIFGKKGWNKEDFEAEIKRLNTTIVVLKSDMERAHKHCEDEHARALEKHNHEHKLKVEKLEADHKIELQQRDFALKNIKDSEILAARSERDIAKEESAVLKKEVEMLRGLVDVHAGIIDVKDLVQNLIKALPKIDLQSLTVNQTSK